MESCWDPWGCGQLSLLQTLRSYLASGESSDVDSPDSIQVLV